MTEERNVNEVMDEQFVEVEETEEKKGLVAKIVNFGKKNGKKLAIGAGIAAVGLIGYALGNKSRGSEETDWDDTQDDVVSDSSDDVAEE